MERQHIIWITVLVYILFIVGISIISGRKSKSISDFTVGGRNAGAWMSAFSYGTAYFSAVMFVGYAGASGWNYGIWGVLPGIGNAIFGSLLAWLVLAKRTRAYTRENDIKTMPQFFEKKFDSTPMKYFSVAIIFIFLVPYSASVYKGLTSICSVLLQVDETICMIVIAVASALIVISGGYSAALKADFFQGIVMLGGVGALIFAVVRCDQVGGFSAGITEMKKITETLELDKYDYIGLWAMVLMTSFGTWGLPQMVQKYYGMKDEKQVKIGTIVSSVFALVIAGGGYFIGSLSHLFFDKNTNLATDYMIPNMLAGAGLSDILLGLILVLLIAASVSTLASITITAASTISIDFIQPVILKKKDTSSTVLTKIISALFILVSYFIATTDTPILSMMSYSWGIISGCFLAPYLLSLYWKRVTKTAAWAAMAAGFLTACPPLVAKITNSGISVSGFGPLSGMGSHFACLAIIVSLIVCVITALITSRKGKTIKA